MRRVIALVAFLLASVSGWADTLRVTTWNLEWFPSGSAKNATPEVEAEHISAAAKVLSVLNPDVVLLQEIRDWDSCQKLATALAPLKYEVIVCSTFKDGFSGTVGRQQVAILAKRTAEAAWAESWKVNGAVDPPRGFAFAMIRYGKHDVGFYSLHLKSNLVRGNDDREVQLNILKRELAAEQVVAHANEMQKKFTGLKAVLVGGDFNTNPDQNLFVSEKTISTFERSGFRCDYLAWPLAERITHPGKGKYPDATFDYLFAKGMRPNAKAEITTTTVSDHRPVTVEFVLPK